MSSLAEEAKKMREAARAKFGVSNGKKAKAAPTREIPTEPPAFITPAELKLESKDEPVIYDDVRPDLCPALAEIILAQAQAINSTPSLNRGGWKSPETFFRWSHPAIAELEKSLVTLLGARPVGWAMVNRFGSGHPRHQHRIAVVTAVYYVAGGDPLTPTVYELPDGTELEVEPQPGRLVICPGDMWHKVPAYAGEQPRITIVADIRR